eukprot:TRINITY_DN9261_c0_g1_i7.p1 TRINITY_DN9261_c0_g1~~TRINITY_DN9261_c0_g1_i7.p1  ORF type:complete len:339 (+),score=53.54 TRINITY_DN9261_c0_g1_i7:275-1291(+)
MFNFALRELTRRTYTFIRDVEQDGPDLKSAALRQNMMRMLMVLAISVRMQLRRRTGGDVALAENFREVKPYLTEMEMEEYEAQVKNRPLLVMSWLGKYVHEANIVYKLDGGQVLMGFDDNLSSSLNGWMGMNKVCYQPYPFPYLHMLHWAVLLWCISMPLMLVKDYGWWTVIIAPVISMALYAIEATSEEIEDPFGNDLNDLPTEEFEHGMKRDSRLALSGGDRDLGTKGMHFASVGNDPSRNLYGCDFSLPLDDLAKNEARTKPVYHAFDDRNCICISCVLGLGTKVVTPDARKKYKAWLEANPGRAAPPSPMSPGNQEKQKAPNSMHGGNAAFPSL